MIRNQNILIWHYEGRYICSERWGITSEKETILR